MSRLHILTLLLGLGLAACQGEPVGNARAAATLAPEAGPATRTLAGLERQTVPTDNPGPPFYARVTPIADQLYHDDGWLVVPFYRPPACVPSDFNLLDLYHPPGPGGPGAFACELLVTGFALIERDAPLGTFPRLAILDGDAVPFWLVPWDAFQAEAADGVVTIDELRALDPVTGTATRYDETLQPRMGEHLVSIRADGVLDDGRHFAVDILNVEGGAWNVHLRLR